MDEGAARSETEPLVLDVEAVAVELLEAVAADRLDRVALAIARLGERVVDDGAVLDLLDGWGRRVAERARGSEAAGWDALEGLLVGELALRGDEDEYDDPRNSFLPDVVSRRRGLPILLSLVYLEVARRAGLPLFGLALPGHFVVGYRARGGGLVVMDPFRDAHILDRAELEALVARAGATLDASMLQPASAHTIAVRMLRNLLGSFERRGRRDRVRVAAALVLALAPGDRQALHALALATDADDN